MVEVVVTRKFQATIPKKIREALGINVGDRLLVKVVGSKIVMEPIKGSDALKRLSTIADRFILSDFQYLGVIDVNYCSSSTSITSLRSGTTSSFNVLKCLSHVTNVRFLL